MINGNINEFIDKLWSGEEVIYVYNGKKYFTQGYVNENDQYYFETQMWEPEEKVLWNVVGKGHEESLEAFYEATIFDGLSFWDIEKETEWVDE